MYWSNNLGPTQITFVCSTSTVCACAFLSQSSPVIPACECVLALECMLLCVFRHHIILWIWPYHLNVRGLWVVFIINCVWGPGFIVCGCSVMHLVGYNLIVKCFQTSVVIFQKWIVSIKKRLQSVNLSVQDKLFAVKMPICLQHLSSHISETCEQQDAVQMYVTQYSSYFFCKKTLFSDLSRL